jgi:hypothetical protein
VELETEGPSSLLQKGKEESRRVVVEFPDLLNDGSLTDRQWHIKKGNPRRSFAHRNEAAGRSSFRERTLNSSASFYTIGFSLKDSKIAEWPD